MTFFAGRRWVPAHRGAWLIEKVDETETQRGDLASDPTAADGDPSPALADQSEAPTT